MVLRRAGFSAVTPIDDTMLISFAQEAGLHGHGMDELSRLASGPYADPLRRGHRHRPQPHQLRRRCRSSAPPPMPPRTPTSRCGCGRRCSPRLRTANALALYEQMERRLIPVLLDMERAGIKVDADDLRAHVGRFRAAHGGDGAGLPPPRRASNSTSAAPSNWARCCSTR